ncbi:glycoside hydrolase family 9 protein [Ruminococcus sp.]|uniref:glycoside hydrolase family 9 protein n=1 Tax=Ruminococcus sp. TaxID=41978 RepID=UPI0025DFF9ED|nr:glycoside hydrolase family 9 protein [Ruminococcus sp.]MCR4639419.1 glycoside hydrolase family 9 protein [Ruminococcus sp.]
MKKSSIKRCAAVLAACTVMAASAPAVSAPTMAAGNLISNSTFESGTTDWGTYKESGGKCSLSTKDGQLALTVSNVGKVNYAVQVFYDIVPLYKNGVYRLKYDISSSVDRFVEGMIQMNGGDYRSYTWKGLQLTSTPQTVDYQFTMKDDTDIMAKLVFNCGIQEKYEGELPEHTIFIDNVSLELVDDSQVDYASSRPYAPSININQVGYRPDSRKIAVFRDVTDQKEFKVVNAVTKEAVYTGKLENMKENSSAGETNWTGDFSSVKEAGKYYIACEGLDDSYTFEIGDKVYSNLIDDSVRMLYLQRCGVKVEDKDFGHEPCHTSMATVYGTSDKIDVSGGWHDAGDYGRYVVPAAKAVADLIYAYDAAPELYSDNIGIPESGNGTPDILDEARFELEWMMKMQASDGGAYHKVSCKTFPGYVDPTKETGELIVTPVSSTATADFCASMALAAEFYEKYDKDFAKKCMDAAEKSWAWLEANPDFKFKNPEDIVTGEYGDLTDRDERYWAAVQMYRATGDEKYIANVSRALTGLDWSTVGDYGNIALLTMKNADKDSEIYKNAVNAVTSQAKSMLSTSNSSPYGVSISKYNWGSNMTIANSGIILSLASKLSGDNELANGANAQLDYLLGTNPLGISFVTGYGTVSPENPHHRPSMAAGHAMKGMLVGGVNQSLEDSAAKAYCKGQPSAKCYVDNSESYSTNEITIYWNSPLTYLLSLTDKTESTQPEVTTTTTTTSATTTTTTSTTTTTTESTTTATNKPDKAVTLAGDANCDGAVDMSDVVIIMQALANPNKFDINGTDEHHLTEQGAVNADVSERGNGMTTADALEIQRYLLHITDKLS